MSGAEGHDGGAARAAAEGIQACVNGPRTPADHPALGAAPAAIAEECRRAVAAGATSLHVHPKDARGRDSLGADAVAAVVEAVRTACPGVPLGITTGAWALPDPGRRVAAIRAWSESALPDFASVNAHEAGARAVGAVLRERGVGVEAGIWHAEGLAAWLADPGRGECLRALVEIQDIADPDEAAAVAGLLVGAIRSAEPGLPILLHGEERSAWTVVRLAGAWGLATRIGLEDTLVLPDGGQARDNAQLVATALAAPGPDT